jgi:hypothetical protein
MRDHGPTIRTFEAREYHRSRLKGMSLEQVRRQALLHRRSEVCATALETLPLLEEYISYSGLTWYRDVGEYLYPVAPDLMLPLKGLGLIGANGKRKLLCLQLWKGTSLSAFQFNVWASFFSAAVLERDPDIDDFDWLEMSIPKGCAERELRVRSLDSARLLSKSELKDLHDHLTAAMLIVANTPKSAPERKRKSASPNQRSFFDQGDP